MADSGDATYQHRNGVVRKLVYDEFAPVIPGNNTLHSVILREYHASALGGHMGEKKLLVKGTDFRGSIGNQLQH